MGTPLFTSKKMKVFGLILLAGVAAGKPSSRNGDDEAADMMACVAGSSLEGKLGDALGYCYGAMGRKASQMRNDGECYTYDEIMQWVESEYSDDVCVLMGIDWMNESFDRNEDMIKDDIATLPERSPLDLRAGSSALRTPLPSMLTMSAR